MADNLRDLTFKAVKPEQVDAPKPQSKRANKNRYYSISAQSIQAAAMAADDYSRHPGNMNDDEFVDSLMDDDEDEDDEEDDPVSPMDVPHGFML